jgi:hypothetical protein
MLSMSKFGDWAEAGVMLQALQTRLYPVCEAKLREDGELLLERMREHIIEQDLNFIPLSPTTVRLKDGDTDIFIDSGFLYDNIEVRKIKSAKNNVTMFVGASPWKQHPAPTKNNPSNSVKMSDLMIWLEFGTDNMPPRPLVRETWDEMESIIKANWNNLLGDLVSRCSDDKY